MKEEIKEILDRLDAEEFELPEYSSPISWVEMFEIRDYITNLQEENERLRKNQKLTPEQRQHLHLEFEELFEIYQKRIDKAIQFIKENDGYAISRNYYDNKLLNILQGEDKECIK